MKESKKVNSYLYKPFKYYSNTSSIENNIDIDSETLNKLLINQQVSITQVELNKLKEIQGVKFDLPISDQMYFSFIGLVGKPESKGLKAGVYIFSHKLTGNQYVGSSNNLSRRLNQYFTFKHIEDSGKLLPLIKKEGFNKFSLEVFVMLIELSSDYYFLFLEQYFLLHKRFNLNIQKIVNFRVTQGTKIYLYDLKGVILYYSSKSLNEVKETLGIHHNTCVNCIKKGSVYLGFFKITTIPIKGARKTDLDVSSLINLISEKKKLFLKNTSKRRFSISVTMREVETRKSFIFVSILDAVKYLKSINVTINRGKIAEVLDTGRSYKGFIFRRTR